jgi:membrane-associated phospholipid phosphatase
MVLNEIVLLATIQHFWKWVVGCDQDLFIQMNSVFTNSFFDQVLPVWREATTWLPLYLFLMLFAAMNFPRKAFSWIVGAIITFAISDQLSGHLIKPLIARLRPCNDPEMFGITRLLLPSCGSGYSFPSSHATNHFAFAVFIYITLGQILGKWKYACILWAASIAYAQIYVGVHYPFDVFCGTLLGTAIGFATAAIYKTRVGIIALDN